MVLVKSGLCGSEADNAMEISKHDGNVDLSNWASSYEKTLGFSNDKRNR